MSKILVSGFAHPLVTYYRDVFLDDYYSKGNPTLTGRWFISESRELFLEVAFTKRNGWFSRSFRRRPEYTTIFKFIHEGYIKEEFHPFIYNCKARYY